MSSQLQAFLIKNAIKTLQHIELIELNNINAEWNFFNSMLKITLSTTNMCKHYENLVIPSYKRGLPVLDITHAVSLCIPLSLWVK
jgi:hypothetical protein